MQNLAVVVLDTPATGANRRGAAQVMQGLLTESPPLPGSKLEASTRTSPRGSASGPSHRQASAAQNALLPFARPMLKALRVTPGANATLQELLLPRQQLEFLARSRTLADGEVADGRHRFSEGRSYPIASPLAMLVCLSGLHAPPCRLTAEEALEVMCLGHGFILARMTRTRNHSTHARVC